MSPGADLEGLSATAKRALLADLLVAREAGVRTFPLSFDQERIWFLHQTAPDSAVLHLTACARVLGPLDVGVLGRCLREVARRHATLRTSFPWVDGRPVQRVDCEASLDVALVTLEGVPHGERESTALGRALHEAAHPMDLEKGPLARVVAYRLEASRHILLAVFHHIVFDEWSIQILQRELAALYDAFAAGRPSPLPELAIQYTDFALWQRNELTGEALEDRMAWWAGRLEEAPRLELPVDRPRAHDHACRPMHLVERLPPATLRRLEDLSEECHATLFMVLTAAVARWLGEVAGQDDVVVGTNFANRSHPHTGQLIGFLVNQLPLRIDLSGGPGFRELVERVREACVTAFAHSEVPTHLLTRRLRPRSKHGRTSLFDVSLAVHDYRVAALSFGGLDFQRIDLLPERGELDLHVFFARTATGDLGVDLIYDAGLFAEESVRKIWRRFEELLQVMLEAPEGKPTAGPKSSPDPGRPPPAFRRVRRRPVGEGREGGVRVEPLAEAGSLPLAVHAERPGLDPLAWLGENRERVETELRARGAVLLRGFAVDSADAFARIVASFGGSPLRYRERSSPRHRVRPGVYTSTDYPPSQRICLHNENSYANEWPMKLFFCCTTEPRKGGETPLADVRRVHDRIGEGVRRRFEARGVLYVRNLGPDLGLPWQEVFQADSRRELEAYCDEAGYSVEWLAGDRVRVRRVGPAVVSHPGTGERVWFNHGAFFHVSSLPEALRGGLLAVVGEEDLPNNTFYGDGAPIEPGVLQEIRAAYAAERVSFRWRPGDVLVVDNMLVAHGREPFEGERRVLVSMTEPMSSRQLAEAEARAGAMP